MKKIWIIRTLIFLTALHLPMVGTSTLVFSGDWSQMYSVTSKGLEGIWGSSATDVFAVGYYGTILHYNGSVWSEMTSGTSQPLRDIWGTSGTDVFAVGGYKDDAGDHGVILHYDGTGWSEVNSGTSICLFSVWGTSATDIFVGGRNIILHYDGNSWSSTNLSTIIYDIWGSSGSDVFAAGSNGAIFHYDGIDWTHMSSGTSKSLFGIWGSSASDVYAVGSEGTILHFDGNTWSSMDEGNPMQPYYQTVWGSSASDIYIAGFAFMYHYNGSTWNFELCIPNFSMNSMWGSSALDIFAVGSMVSDGIIYHYSDDFDQDGVPNESDNCQYISNADQSDMDGDGAGDACDNCPSVHNPDQFDFDFDGQGNTCEDSDGDGLNDDADNCPSVSNPGQEDSDGDGYGDGCDNGNRFVVADQQTKEIFVFDLDGTLIKKADLSAVGDLYFIRDAGNSGWLLKGLGNNTWKICHVDSSGALRSVFTDLPVGPGPYYSGLKDGNFVISNKNTGDIYLYSDSGLPVASTNAWSDPNGWSYNFKVMGDIVGLTGGAFVTLPELGSIESGGQGYTPYLYFYDSNINLINKVDITAHHITLYMLAGLSSGGFVGIGNTDGSNIDTHLFYFDASGVLTELRDLRNDIPGIVINDYMDYPVSSTNDGGVIVTQLYSKEVWIFHSPPIAMDLSSQGVNSIGGIGGSYFQPTNTSSQPSSTSSSTTTIPGQNTTTIPSNSTTTTTGVPSCIAAVIYGEQSEEVKLLREFRDRVLLENASGRQLIAAYYMLSPEAAKILHHSEAARKNVRRAFDSLLPAISKILK